MYIKFTQENFQKEFHKLSGITSFPSPFECENEEERKKLEKTILWYIPYVKGIENIEFSYKKEPNKKVQNKKEEVFIISEDGKYIEF